MEKIVIIIIGMCLAFLLGGLYYKSIRSSKVSANKFVVITMKTNSKGVPKISIDTNSEKHALAIGRMMRIALVQELVDSGLMKVGDEAFNLFFASRVLSSDDCPYSDDGWLVGAPDEVVHEKIVGDLDFEDVTVGIRRPKS